MSTETALIDSALRTWKQNIDRVDKFFSTLSDERLQQEIAPGKNRLIYLWGHLTAVNDMLLPLLGVGSRLHPEIDAIFVKNPDRSSPDTFSGKDLKRIWDEINQSLSTAFSKLTPAEWLQKHTTVSEEDFEKEPHRNRFTILLARTGHLAYHYGQAALTEKRG
jgi:DinB superfamily